MILGFKKNFAFLNFSKLNMFNLDSPLFLPQAKVVWKSSLWGVGSCVPSLPQGHVRSLRGCG